MSPDDNWARQAAYYRNEFAQSAGQLVGIVTGLVADNVLSDAEIRFLDAWLAARSEVTIDWPGNIVYQRVRSVLEDGVITEDERAHLLVTLQAFIGGDPATFQQAGQVTELAFDEVSQITFPDSAFCLTGNFVYAPRNACEQVIVARGGIVRKGVSKKLDFLVVGSLGSPEWKHGAYGTKIDAAMQLKAGGVPIKVLREDTWSAAL